MSRTWQLQEAKNRFSEVVDKALEEGPQVVTRHGVEDAVVLSMADFRKLTRRRQSLVEFFARSPLREVKLDLTRDKDAGRTVDLEVSPRYVADLGARQDSTRKEGRRVGRKRRR